MGIIELTINAGNTIEKIYNGFGKIKADLYYNLIDEYQEIYDKLKNEDPDIYRVESKYELSLNDALSFGFKGLNFEGSTYQKSLYEFLMNIGYSKEHVSVLSDIGNTKTLDMILGVKYIMNPKHDIGLKDYQKIQLKEDVAIYKNPYALNLGYVVSEKIEFEPDINNSNPFENQNILIKNLTGLNKNIYEQHDGDIKEINENLKKDGSYYTKINKQEKAKLIYQFEAEKNEEVYLYIIRK